MITVARRALISDGSVLSHQLQPTSINQSTKPNRHPQLTNPQVQQVEWSRMTLHLSLIGMEKSSMEISLANICSYFQRSKHQPAFALRHLSPIKAHLLPRGYLKSLEIISVNIIVLGKSYSSCEVTPSLSIPRQFQFFRQRKCQGQGGQQLDWDITHSSWNCQLVPIHLESSPKTEILRELFP